MATKQIKDLSAKTALALTDQFILQQASDNDTLKTTLQSFIDAIYPVGCFYAQYPDADSSTFGTAFPDAKAPAALFGGTWAAQWETENVFFRTNGTDYQARTTGLSADQMQAITGSISTFATNASLLTATATTAGALSKGTVSNATSPAGASIVGYNIDFNSANSPGARTGAITEPRNRLVRIWKRTA